MATPSGSPYQTPQQARGAPGAAPGQKVPPAPGASPQGGTTSLPQHLQSPGIAPGGSPYMPGGGAGTPAPGAPGGSTPGATPPPVPASTPPGAVPPPPPPPTTPTAPPVPAAPPAPGHNTGGPDDLNIENAAHTQQMGGDLFKQLMEMLNNPSRYGAAEAQKTRDQGMQRLKDEQTIAMDKATANAAGRGVYNGTPLTNSLGDIGQQFIRGSADLETNIERDQAQQYQNDRNSAIQAIFGYGDRQNQQSQWQQDLWLRIQQMLGQGGPQYPANTTPPIPQ